MIKKFILFFLLILLSLLIPQKVRAESIQNFLSSILINQNGTIDVTETIDYDFGNEFRHGIYRTIPFTKTNEQGEKFKLDIKVISVLDTFEKPYKYKTEISGDSINIRIGDPNKTITGRHTYILHYLVSGALTYFPDFDELYWDATGIEWEVPITRTQAVIQLPQKIDPSDLQTFCYTGVFGSTDKNCLSNYSNGITRIETTKALDAGEGLTIAVDFPKKIVEVLEPQEYKTFWQTPFGILVKYILIASLIIVSVLWYIVYPIWIPIKWYKLGRDPKPTLGVTSAWFSPSKSKTHRNLTPAETGALIDEEADREDISATIVDLAVRKYIKIIEKKKGEFKLEKLSNENQVEKLQTFEKTFLKEVFKNKNTLDLKGANLYAEIEKVKNEIYLQLVKEEFFPENPAKVRRFYSIISGLAVTTFNFALAVSAFFFGRNMPKKTLFGAEQLAVAKSLRNFLSSQKVKLEFQAKNQMFFEKLLPYAIAFGVEKVWADRFKDIHMKQPEWYQGSSTSPTFSSYHFVRSLDTSLASFQNASSPARSSSGFSSGGGGGGSSGGGGGGGGGGSW